MLPGEIRNAIYRELVTPEDPFGLFNEIALFGAQPALSRVNKQIRAESLSIYYGENYFRLDIQLSDDYSDLAFVYQIRYPDFCHCMDVFAPPQGRTRRIGGPMHHVRELVVDIMFGDSSPWMVSFNGDFFPWKARFTISRAKFKMLSMYSGFRLGGDETNWADLLGIVTLVKNRMDAEPISYRMKPNTQQRLVRVLGLLGLCFRSNVWTHVTLSRG